MSAFQSEVLEDGAHLRLSLGGENPGQIELETNELDDLIRDLLQRRREMEPEPEPAEPSMLVLDDGRRLHLEISTHPEPTVFQMSATEVEDFIYWLMENRMVMDPVIPDADPVAGTKFLPRSGRRWWIEAHPDQGMITLAMQHAGLGWLWLSLTPAACATMVTQLVNAVKQLPPE